MQHSPGFVSLVESIRPSVTEISIEAFQAEPQLILIDVREDHEWQQGHIPNAVHMGRGIIERDIEKRFTDFNVSLVLYCGGGHRSVMAASHLQKMGYTNVKSLIGGYKSWMAAGLPIAKESK
ncbi:rhodanese-like domain-containing protein [Shewanella maritima]|uniref:rhodanese-like domain-containing protein n=1 Tax=Shewanella maritima TaxID=2520507 RepID=UPI003735579E